MKTGKRQWRELAVPVLVFMLFLPLLLGLSFWQYERGEEKSAHWQEFEQSGGAAVALDGNDIISQVNALPRYQRVSVQGEYLPQYQVLLDNLPEQGRPGWHVLTPFRIAGSDAIILVDRGWLPKQAGEIPKLAVSAKMRRIEGRLADLPRPGLELETAEPPKGWPKPMQFPDVAAVAKELRKAGITARVVPRILWLDASAADGFKREWQPAGLTPARHYAYSFQWLALALTLVIIFVVLLRRWWRKPVSDSRPGN